MYKILAALFLVVNIQGLQTKSIPPSFITHCTLEEAFAINRKYLESILVSADHVLTSTNEEVSQENDNLAILITESIENNEKVINDLQITLDDVQIAAENDLTNAICVARIQFHLDALSDHSKTKFAQCILHSQNEQRRLLSEQTSVQETANSMKIKASISLDEYTLEKYYVAECIDLDLNLKTQTSSFLKKIDSLTNKINKSVNRLSEDYQKCYYRAALSTYPYVAFIKQHIATCMASITEQSRDDSQLRHTGEFSTTPQEITMLHYVTSNELTISQGFDQTLGFVRSKQTTPEVFESTETGLEGSVDSESSTEERDNSNNVEKIFQAPSAIDRVSQNTIEDEISSENQFNNVGKNSELLHNVDAIEDQESNLAIEQKQQSDEVEQKRDGNQNAAQEGNKEEVKQE